MERSGETQCSAQMLSICRWWAHDNRAHAAPGAGIRDSSSYTLFDGWGWIFRDLPAARLLAASSRAGPRAGCATSQWVGTPSNRPSNRPVRWCMVHECVCSALAALNGGRSEQTVCHQRTCRRTWTPWHRVRRTIRRAARLLWAVDRGVGGQGGCERESGPPSTLRRPGSNVHTESQAVIYLLRTRTQAARGRLPPQPAPRSAGPGLGPASSWHCQLSYSVRVFHSVRSLHALHGEGPMGA